MKEYTNSQIAHLIDEYIHHKRDRLILKAHYIDGESAEEIAAREEVKLTPRRVSTILSERLLQISDKL